MECTVVMTTIGSSRTHLEVVDQPFTTRIEVAAVITSIRNSSVSSDLKVDREAVLDRQLRREADSGELVAVQEALLRMLLRRTRDASQM